MDNLNTNLKYIAYCRKSSDNEDRQVLSIESQIRELKEYAQKHNLYLVDIITESKSAYKPGREGFDEMLNRFEASEANAMLVWHANRIARNSLDGGRVIWFMDREIILQIDTTTKQYHNTPDDKFYLNLEFTMSKKSSDDLSQVVKRGIRQKYERGEYPTYAPIGYINTKVDGAKNIAPDPERWSLLAKVFEEMATGKYSLGQMIKSAFDWGLRTRKGKPVSKSHLHRIVQNPAYYGVYRHGGEMHPGTYEPLISKSLFDKVQIVLKDRSKPKKITNDWAYAGLVKCGCGCGASIIFETKKKHYARTNRWAEYTYARSSKRIGTCTQKGISLTELERQIEEKLAPVSIDEEEWKLGIELLNVKYEAEAKRRTDIVHGLQRQRQRLQGELDGYFKMRSKEEMTAEEFATKKKKVEGDQKKLDEKVGDGVQAQRSWLELSEDFFNTCYQAREMLNSDSLEAKRKAVRKVGWNLLLKDKMLVWSYQKPYDVLLKPTYRSDWRRGWDSNPREPYGSRV